MTDFLRRRSPFLVPFLVLALTAVVLSVWASSSPLIPLRLVDFENYLAGSRIIWNSGNPYGEVEFFAPPWMAVLIGPFLLLPMPAASMMWLLFNFGAVFLAAAVAVRWTAFPGGSAAGKFLPAVFSLMPASLFCYISGQVSPLVGCALVVFAWCLVEKKGSPVLFALLAIVAAFKPHLVFLPLGICLLELFRNRKWKILLSIAAGFSLAVLFAFLTNRDWISNLVRAWQAGDFLGGRPGLAASGYRGLSDFGIPLWLFLPYALYLLYRWKREGVTDATMALAITVGFLLFPYSRRYDYVLFILPGCVLIRDLSWRKWLPAGIAILSLLVVPLLSLALLAPILLTLGILLEGGRPSAPTLSNP